MMLRAVYVTIAPGRTDEYWEWARQILELWEAHGIRRHGGPFRGTDTHGRDTALWLTWHDSDEAEQREFKEMYAQPSGRALIERRAPLVVDTRMERYDSFDT